MLKILIFGTGNGYQRMKRYFDCTKVQVVAFVDNDEKEGSCFEGKPVICPLEINGYQYDYIIIASIFHKEISSQLIKQGIKSEEILCYYDYESSDYEIVALMFKDVSWGEEKKLRVRIVCYDDVNAWILGKFARKLNEELLALNVVSDIAKIPDPTADINHHIIYYDFDGKKTSNETMMITHIDSVKKINLIKKQLNEAKMGICMSTDTMNQLICSGVPREKLCYVNPAQDGVITPKAFVIGITSRTYSDFRKGESFLIEICKNIDLRFFSFKIMGAGWQSTVEVIRNMGFVVEYYPDFEYGEYIQLVKSLDYYLYLGFDEGSMGFIDALAAGVPTIVTPQGYHLDVYHGITYPVKNLSEVINVFKTIAEPKQKMVESVSQWTWSNYAKKHLEIWEYVLRRKPVRKLMSNKGKYIDGIFSVLMQDLTGRYWEEDGR